MLNTANVLTSENRNTLKSELFGVPISEAIFCPKSKQNCSDFGLKSSLDHFRYKKKNYLKNGPAFCPNCRRLDFKCLKTSEIQTKSIGFWMDFYNRTFGNGTIILVPKSEHIRISDFDCNMKMVILMTVNFYE